MQPYADFRIIAGKLDAHNPEVDGVNLYTPCYGDTFLGNFSTVKLAACEAARLADDKLQSIKVL
jgi:hypothetical protein